jgi:hypothetical protein
MTQEAISEAEGVATHRDVEGVIDGVCGLAIHKHLGGDQVVNEAQLIVVHLLRKDR